MKRAISYSLGLILFGLLANAQLYSPYGQIQGSSGYLDANGRNLGIGHKALEVKLNSDTAVVAIRRLVRRNNNLI